MEVMAVPLYVERDDEKTAKDDFGGKFEGRRKIDKVSYCCEHEIVICNVRLENQMESFTNQIHFHGHLLLRDHHQDRQEL